MPGLFDEWDARRNRAERPTGQPATPVDPGRASAYALAALAGEVANIQAVPVGSGRNDQLNKSALKMYGLAEAGAIDHATVTEVLGAADGGLDYPATRKTLQSARDAAARLGARVIPDQPPGAASREPAPWETVSDDPFADIYVGPMPGTTTTAKVAADTANPSSDSTSDSQPSSDSLLSEPSSVDGATDAATSPAPDPLVALEAAKLRIRRAATRIVAHEDAVRDFRPPPYLDTLTDDLDQPDEPVTYAVAEVIPTGANVLLTAQYKTGKALAAGEEVQTPRGPIKIGDLTAGDKILHPSGGVTTVEGVYPQGVRDLFDVEFSDGAVVRCDAEHLWTVERGQGAPRTVTLAEIMRDGVRDARGNARWHVPITRPVRYVDSAPLPVAPYLLGVLLGDGSLTDGTPKLTNVDQYVIDTARTLLPDGVEMRRVADTITHSLTAAGTRRNRNPLTVALESLGVMGVHSRDKRIPESYRRASIDDRIALLRGLMDTDGTVDKRGHAAIATASEALADDIAELAQSLGGLCRIQRKQTRHPARDSSIIHGIAWVCSIRFDNLCPFTLPRHVERYRPGQRRGIRRSIRRVAPAGAGDAVCIKVAAPDGLFLTRGYVTTHNTTTMLNLVRSLADRRAFLGRYDVADLDGRVAMWNYEVDGRQMRRWLRDARIESTDRVALLNLRGYRLPLTVPHVEDWVVDWLQRAEARVWIVDPFARAAVGSITSENDNTEVGAFLDTLDVIKDRAGVGELILPTHTGRAVHDEGDERARGATRLDDWADVRWLLTKDKSDRRFFRATGRDVETDEGALDYDGDTRELTLTGGSRRDVADDRVRDAILTGITNRAGLGVTEIRNTVREQLGRSDNNRADRIATELVAAGVLRVEVIGNKACHFRTGVQPDIDAFS